jgi:alpha-methylacyl-CoA racemase
MGPLQDLKVLEFAGIGPGPFAAMVLSDLGAEVLRVTRPGARGLLEDDGADVLTRGRAEVALDLKTARGAELALSLIERSDALIEGFRPGVMERLGLGPDAVFARNPQVVYGRMTGYGQDGPWAQRPGHDINYLSLTGVLGAMARDGQRPLFPLNLLGDYAGGGLLLALGVVSAVLEARQSQHGQVVDAAMVDGVALLSTVIHGLSQAGGWSDRAGTNVLDSGAHFYEVYETSDGGHVAVGAIEPQFYATLLKVLGVQESEMPQWDRPRWPEFKRRLIDIFRRRSRDEWARSFEHEDACATPVLELREAPSDPHLRARGTFVSSLGYTRPAPAPRFSRTPASAAQSAPQLRAVLSAWGIAGAALAEMAPPS